MCSHRRLTAFAGDTKYRISDGSNSVAANKNRYNYKEIEDDRQGAHQPCVVCGGFLITVGNRSYERFDTWKTICHRARNLATLKMNYHLPATMFDVEIFSPVPTNVFQNL